jgi:tripartite-type tricarboxylate transporter receptor subunit TctC
MCARRPTLSMSYQTSEVLGTRDRLNFCGVSRIWRCNCGTRRQINRRESRSEHLHGRVQIGVLALAPAAPHIQGGNLRALAVMSETRSQSLPDIPTMAEAGYPGIKADNWVGVLMPAGTPKEIITLLHREIASIITLADMKERLAALGFEPVASTPEEFADRIKVDLETWGKLIRAANLKAG